MVTSNQNMLNQKSFSQITPLASWDAVLALGTALDGGLGLGLLFASGFGLGVCLEVLSMPSCSKAGSIEAGFDLSSAQCIYDST